MPTSRLSLFALALLAACGPEDLTLETELEPGDEAVVAPFTWRMAGVLVLGNEALTTSPATLVANRISYVGQYAMNGCANNNAPYSCAANACNYPGNPQSTEIPTYAALRDWFVVHQGAGLYAGLWGRSYNNVEAEAHCMAEVANTLRASWGVTPTFYNVNAEKSFEVNPGYSERFVPEFNRTLTFPLHKALTPECHTEVPFHVWLSGGFTSIQPMAYWNDPTMALNPAYCLKWSLDYGVPRDMCQVMLDGYTHGAPVPWSQYADDIKAWGGTGFSIWRTVNPDEWSTFGALIQTRGIAVYDGSPQPRPPAGTNLARSGAVTASSAYDPVAYPNSNLIDGNPDTFTHTTGTGAGWLKVSLPRVGTVNEVRLFNRGDCCQERLKSYSIDLDPNDCQFDDARRVVQQTNVPAGRPSIFPVAALPAKCVRLKLDEVTALHPGELEVWGTSTTATNVARGKRVTASSAWNAALYPNANLVDGNRDTFPHTSAQAGAWLKVDLLRTAWVSRLDLYNRADCCQDRLASYTVDVDPNDCAFNSDAVRIATVAGTPAGRPSTWRFSERRVRCIRVQLTGTGALHPGELEAFGWFPPTSDVARGRPVVASSAYEAALFPPSHLTDGNAESFPHTLNEDRAWLTIDLGRVRAVSGARLWNRADCCQERLDTYAVELDYDDCAFDNFTRPINVVGQPAGRPTSWTFGERNARCVRIIQNEYGPLHPAQLEVIGY